MWVSWLDFVQYDIVGWIIAETHRDWEYQTQKKLKNSNSVCRSFFLSLNNLEVANEILVNLIGVTHEVNLVPGG